jgi:ATP-binding cassette subfamily F protein 3
MIRLQNLTLQRGPQRLLEDAEMTLHAGQKAGLIGANGAGKSSLFALLRGELSPDSDCLLPADWRIAHMRQEVDTLDRLAVDYVLDGDLRLRQVQRDLAAAEAAHDGAAQARLHWNSTAPTATPPMPVRASCWPAWVHQRPDGPPVGDFSGGWRMRLNLAQALMCPSDLLLLDEPTNHLDLDAILWLEDWLKSYPAPCC